MLSILKLNSLEYNLILNLFIVRFLSEDQNYLFRGTQNRSNCFNIILKKHHPFMI